MQVMDIFSFFGKVLFVFRHDIGGVIRTSMQIIRLFPDGPAAQGQRLQGKGKQIIVIRLHDQISVFTEDALVDRQETFRSQPPFGVLFLGPGIAEIKVNAVHLPRLKNLFQVQGIIK